MVYSVWDQSRSAYDYYRTSEKNGRVNADPPRHLRQSTHGTPARAAAYPLPAGARHVGSGPTPKGKIAARRGDLALTQLGGVADVRAVGKVGAAAVIGYLAGRFLR